MTNWMEITGVILSLVYLYFSIKQKFLLWPFGLASAIFYILIYFSAKFYADMGLQVYYVGISIYGWILWTRKKTDNQKQDRLLVSQTSHKLWILIFLAFLILWVGIYYVLRQFTDSDIPMGDAFTTAGGVVATWMLARKKIEHWLLWIVIDLISMLLYIYKGLYPTSFLFLVYTGMAYFGYLTWKKDLRKK